MPFAYRSPKGTVERLIVCYFVCFLLLPQLLESIHESVENKNCSKLIDYRGKRFEFKGQYWETSNVTLSLDELSNEITDIYSIADMANTLDDFQSNLCKTNLALEENPKGEELVRYTRTLVGAQVCLLKFMNALLAYIEDPTRQRGKLGAIVTILQKFVNSITPEINTEQLNKVVYDVFSFVDSAEKEEASKVIVVPRRSGTRLWSLEDAESTVMRENNLLEMRLTKVVAQIPNLQLSKGMSLGIPALVHIIVSNGLLPEKSREYSKIITSIRNKVAHDHPITIDEYGDYAIAIAWFELQLQDLEKEDQVGFVMDNGFQLDLIKMRPLQQYMFVYDNIMYIAVKNKKGDLDLTELTFSRDSLVPSSSTTTTTFSENVEENFISDGETRNLNNSVKQDRENSGTLE